MARLAAEREALVDYFGPVEVSIADLYCFLIPVTFVYCRPAT